MLVLRYEDLIGNPQEMMTEVLEFVGEEFEPGVLEFYKTPRYYYSNEIKKPEDEDHMMLRNWQINQPIFDGRGRYRELSSWDLMIVEEYLGEMLKEYGYGNRGLLGMRV